MVIYVREEVINNISMDLKKIDIKNIKDEHKENIISFLKGVGNSSFRDGVAKIELSVFKSLYKVYEGCVDNEIKISGLTMVSMLSLAEGLLDGVDSFPKKYEPNCRNIIATYGAERPQSKNTYNSINNFFMAYYKEHPFSKIEIDSVDNEKGFNFYE